MPVKNEKVSAWRILLIILSFMAAFLFYEVVGIPKTYPTKVEVNSALERIETSVSGAIIVIHSYFRRVPGR